MDELLEVQELTIGYADRKLIEHISFRLKQGEIIAVLGPNGCGKSTLFRTLLNLAPALQGEVHLAGQNINEQDRPTIAQRLSYVPQQQLPSFPLHVLDIVVMGRAARLNLFSAPTAGDYDLARQSLYELGIAGLAEREFGSLSGGERQLVLIARALTQTAPLLIMDEPMANLDFGNQLRVLSEIEKLRRQNYGVLFSTHQPDHALRCADQALLLGMGQVLALGKPATVITEAHLHAMYKLHVSIATLHTASGMRQICVPM